MQIGQNVTLQHGMGIGSYSCLNTEFLREEGYMGGAVPIVAVSDDGKTATVRLPSDYELNITRRDLR